MSLICALCHSSFARLLFSVSVFCFPNARACASLIIPLPSIACDSSLLLGAIVYSAFLTWLRLQRMNLLSNTVTVQAEGKLVIFDPWQAISYFGC